MVLMGATPEQDTWNQLNVAEVEKTQKIIVLAVGIL